MMYTFKNTPHVRVGAQFLYHFRYITVCNPASSHYTEGVPKNAAEDLDSISQISPLTAHCLS